MDLTTRVNKAVEAHLERVNALNRSLRFLPMKNGKPDTSEKTLERIRAGKLTPPRVNGGVLWQHYDRLRLSRGWDETTPENEFLPTVCLSAAIEDSTLTSEPTTFVASDIIDMLMVAADKLAAEPLRATDVFAPSGFIYLEKPIVVNIPAQHFESRERDELVGIRAISWRTSDSIVPAADPTVTRTSGIQTCIYTDAGCIRYITEAPQHLPDTMPDHVLEMIDASGWAYGQIWRGAEDGERHGIYDGVVVATPDTEIVRNFLLSLFRFMWQELLTREPAELPRAIRRGAVRSLGHDDPITILKLRRSRTASGETTGDGSRLDHRILVRGHWRNQYYPSLGPVEEAGSHRLIWIDPHVKGPEDAPFVAKPKATAVIR